MFKRTISIGALFVSMLGLFATNANAQFDGWGWFGFSDIRGEIKTIKTPNPQGKPSQITVTVDATIQIACKNPATNGVFNGIAFHRSLAASVPFGTGVVTDKGDVTTVVLLPLGRFEVPENCPNKKWTPITAKNSGTGHGSAMALSFSGSVLWCLVGENGGSDCGRKGLLDASPVTCSLDMTDPENQRNPDGTAPHADPPFSRGAVFTCSAPE